MAEVQVAGEVDSGDYEGAEARKVAYAASSVETSENRFRPRTRPEMMIKACSYS